MQKYKKFWKLKRFQPKNYIICIYISFLVLIIHLYPKLLLSLQLKILKTLNKMILDNTIEKNEDTLMMLDDSLPQASVDRFVFGYV